MAANEPGQPALNAAPAADRWSRDLAAPRVALAVGAHPDDVEFGCGATLAKWAAAGCEIHHLILTDGSKGTWNPDADIAALVVTREREQRDAAMALGGGRDGVTFLHQVDGELQPTHELVGRVAHVIRTVQPDVLLGHDPWKRYRLHPDHRNAGILVCDALVAARDPHFFRSHGLQPHRPHALLLWEADEPDHLESLTSTNVDAKLRALLTHESQFESTMKAVDDAQIVTFTDRIRSRLAGLGEPFGVAAAEVFKLMADL